MARFDGKRVLITGGTSGIGLATAKRIVAEGGEVAVTGTSQDHLDEAGRSLPSGSLVLRNDAADPEAAEELGRKVKDQMGEIDGLFLNAGYGKFAPIGESDAALTDAMLAVNVRGPILHMKHLEGALKDGASVLITASVSPYLGQAQGAVYAASKGAVTALTTAWAAELAGRKIRVNSIAPGPIDSNFMHATGLSDEEIEGFKQQITDQVALGRFGESEEVAAVACFLLSEDASYVTGSQYMVDGGMTMR